MAGQSKLKRRRTAAATTLNDLPDDVLISIISLLPLFAAIETSFISRRWRNLWHFIPNLEFCLPSPGSSISRKWRNHWNFSLDQPHQQVSTITRELLSPEEHLRLINTITQVLLNRPKSIPLRVFRFAVRYFPNHRHRSLISTWLHYALDCRVEDLTLTFKGHDDPKNLYDFHFSDLSNKHVKCLSLYHCEIVMPGNVSVRFDSLRVLKLSSVDLADELLTNLISSCCNLEKLCLDFFDGLRHFRICSKSLKFLKLLRSRTGAISQYSSMELCTPNLSKIKVKQFYATFMGDLSSVKEATISLSYIFDYCGECWGSVMNSLSGVESLTVTGFVPSNLKFDECVQLRRLRHLELTVGYPLDNLLGVSLLLEQLPALETLVLGIIIFHTDWSEEDEEEEMAYAVPFLSEISKRMEFKFRSLREVRIEGFRNRMAENLILRLLDERRVVLNKVVLVPANLCEAPDVLDPTADALSSFWDNCLMATLDVLMKRESTDPQLLEAMRALKRTQTTEEEREN